MIDPITDNDLMAYVDSQLDIARRIEVEDYLARNPEAAAQVMADLRARDALHLAFAGELPQPTDRLLNAARRLERSLAFRRVGQRLLRAATIALLVGAGWVAHGSIGLGVTDSEASPKPPAFVEDALRSHQTALVRARMISQVETADYDPVEIRAETGIQIPPLPGDWRVLDAQVFPSRSGHSIELAVEAEGLGRVSLFIANTSAFGVISPTIARFDGIRAIYWQAGSVAYALTGAGNERDIEHAASRLKSKLQ